jgi:YVTN family beta-propeller protein
VIDLSARKMVGSIDLGHGVRPHYAVWGKKSGLLYVTSEVDQTITIVDPKARKVVATIPTGSAESHWVAVSSDEQRAYTANVYTGTVSVLDLPGRKLLMQIPVAPAKTADAKREWRTQRLALSPDDKTLYTCDWITSELVAIDTAANRVRARAKIPSACYSVAATPDGRFVLAAARDAKKLAVVDARSMKTVREIDVPATPQQVILRADGQMAFVSCDMAQKVVAIRTSDWAIDRTIDTGYWPDGLAWVSGN